MAAYIIAAACDVTDPAGFEEYQKLAGPTLTSYGGKSVAHSESVEVMEGDWAPLGFMVAEFESVEQAKRWYNSPEYQAALPMHNSSTNSRLIIGGST